MTFDRVLHPWLLRLKQDTLRPIDRVHAAAGRESFGLREV
jgi:hypothetical protein